MFAVSEKEKLAFICDIYDAVIHRLDLTVQTNFESFSKKRAVVFSEDSGNN